ncbi:50S ribosomal protein L9 [Candidatus Fermentibacteria bacterium]|nr:MAG: 50S ribosomal protein L9 [Candidatus Fermentibacteria bacterium]
MKVLLIKTVDSLGTAGDVVTVAAGYARNYLLPKKLAVIATPGSMKMAASLKAAAEAKALEENKAAETLAAKLRETELSFSATADENGQLYGGIGEREIAAALVEKNFEIDRNQIILPAHIKNVGEHEVEIKVHGEIHEKIKVRVEAQS